MESGKNNRNKEMLDDYIGYKLATENSSQLVRSILKESLSLC